MKEKEYQQINKEIQINLLDYPKIIQNVAEELEDYDLKGEWVMYDGVADGLEAIAKQSLITGLINEEQFKNLLRRYGR